MSLPTKVVPKSGTVAVSGPGSGPSPAGQLRAALTSLPPGAPLAPQPAAGLPPQYPLSAGTSHPLAFKFKHYPFKKHSCIL